MLIKLFEACGAIYKSATKPALNSLHRPYRFLWTAFFFTPGPLALCVTKPIREKLWKCIVQGTFLPTFSLPGMDGWVSLFDIASLQTNPVLVQFHAFITTSRLRLGFAMSFNSFSEESVKIMHLLNLCQSRGRRIQNFPAIRTDSYCFAKVMWSSCNGTWNLYFEISDLASVIRCWFYRN